MIKISHFYVKIYTQLRQKHNKLNAEKDFFLSYLCEKQITINALKLELYKEKCKIKRNHPHSKRKKKKRKI